MIKLSAASLASLRALPSLNLTKKPPGSRPKTRALQVEGSASRDTANGMIVPRPRPFVLAPSVHRRWTVSMSGTARSQEPNPRVEQLRQEAAQRGKIVVAPSVAKADFWNWGEEVTAAVLAGADWLHFSVQDGRMAPRISIGSPVVKSARGRMPDVVFDVKLTVLEPEHRIAEFVRAGADIISVHPEATLQLPAVLHKIQASSSPSSNPLPAPSPASPLSPCSLSI